ncbi:MAG: hypothetical protein DI556_13370 [Rhodovulum sulfidophilum]|uniref:Conjugal transfer protein TraN n=1 Tax=Rhodovulum sulfidophilum TaxID=35806 RepID=A0A2W5N940_RHOSU|nr:MAG: hypothetical protein DI556_13370 [Rhodovulum sulfidophilum]
MSVDPKLEATAPSPGRGRSLARGAARVLAIALVAHEAVAPSLVMAQTSQEMRDAAGFADSELFKPTLDDLFSSDGEGGLTIGEEELSVQDLFYGVEPIGGADNPLPGDVKRIEDLYDGRDANLGRMSVSEGLYGATGDLNAEAGALEVLSGTDEIPSLANELWLEPSRDAMTDTAALRQEFAECVVRSVPGTITETYQSTRTELCETWTVDSRPIEAVRAYNGLDVTRDGEDWICSWRGSSFLTDDPANCGVLTLFEDPPDHIERISSCGENCSVLLTEQFHGRAPKPPADIRAAFPWVEAITSYAEFCARPENITPTAVDYENFGGGGVGPRSRAWLIHDEVNNYPGANGVYSTADTDEIYDCAWLEGLARPSFSYPTFQRDGVEVPVWTESSTKYLGAYPRYLYWRYFFGLENGPAPDISWQWLEAGRVESIRTRWIEKDLGSLSIRANGTMLLRDTTDTGPEESDWADASALIGTTADTVIKQDGSVTKPYRLEIEVDYAPRDLEAFTPWEFDNTRYQQLVALVETLTELGSEEEQTCELAYTCATDVDFDGDGCVTDANGALLCGEDIPDPGVFPAGLVPATCTALAVTPNCPEEMLQPQDTCEQFAEDPACSFTRGECQIRDSLGNCLYNEVSYQCVDGGSYDTPVQTTEYMCEGDISCLGEDCVVPNRSDATADLAEVATKLASVDMMSQDMNCAIDPTSVSGTAAVSAALATCEVFAGERQVCDRSTIGGSNCCVEAEGVNLTDYLQLMFAVSRLASTAADLGFENPIASAWATAGDFTRNSWSTLSRPMVEVWENVIGYTGVPVDQVASTVSLEAIKGALMNSAAEWTYQMFGQSAANALFVNGSGAGALFTAGGQIELGATAAFSSGVTMALSAVSAAYTAYLIYELVIDLISACDEDEYALMAAKALRNTHYIDTSCQRSVLGFCIERREYYCVYNSPLSRIMMENYRRIYGDDDWGDRGSPECGGIPYAEIANVDFEAFDLSEWTGMLMESDIVEPMKALDLEGLTGSSSTLGEGLADLYPREDAMERNLKRFAELDADGIRDDASEDYLIDVDEELGDPGEDDDYVPGDEGEPPVITGCRPVWSPPIDTFCARTTPITSAEHAGAWYTDRVDCGTGPNGWPSMVINEYRNLYVSAVNVARTTNIPAEMKASNVVRLSADFYVPSSYRWTASGRLPLGINVGPFTSGGATGAAQKGSSVRMHIWDDGTVGLYAYNFDRTSPVVHGSGQYSSTVKTRQYGQGAGRISTPIPRDQWVTIAVEMVLGPRGADRDAANIYMYDAAGNLIGQSGKANVTFRRATDSFGVEGILADAKLNKSVTPSQNQALYVKNYQGFVCDAN